MAARGWEGEGWAMAVAGKGDWGWGAVGWAAAAPARAGAGGAAEGMVVEAGEAAPAKEGWDWVEAG